MMFSFKAIITSRGYHVYQETSWSNAKLGHIPREISWYVYFLIKGENGKVS